MEIFCFFSQFLRVKNIFDFLDLLIRCHKNFTLLHLVINVDCMKNGQIVRLRFCF